MKKSLMFPLLLPLCISSAFADQSQVTFEGAVQTNLTAKVELTTSARTRLFTCETSQGDPLDGIEWNPKTEVANGQGTQNSGTYSITATADTGGFCEYQASSVSLLVHDPKNAGESDGLTPNITAAVVDAPIAGKHNLRDVANLNCSYSYDQTNHFLECMTLASDGTVLDQPHYFLYDFYVLSSDLGTAFQINVNLE